MKKIIIILSLGIFYNLIFNSCKEKCESNNLGKVSFTQEDLKIVPYKGSEILSFSDSLGNVLNFNEGKRRSNYNEIIYEYPSSEVDDCKGDYFYPEINYTNFLGEGLNSFILVNLNMDRGNPFNQNINKFIVINVVFSDTRIWNFNCGFNFYTLKIFKNIDTTKSMLSYKDSLVIGQKKYFSVYVLKQIKDPETSNNLQYVFYTINNGIVGFKTKEGHAWYLNN
jgi:hypothetical protein